MMFVVHAVNSTRVRRCARSTMHGIMYRVFCVLVIVNALHSMPYH